MKKLIVAVGSTRAPKLNAVRSALIEIGPLLFKGGEQADQIETVGVAVHSGVDHTPRSRAETMAGARGRAEALAARARETGEQWSYFVGLEGGVDIVQEKGRRWVFLENWAFVSDGAGRECFGQAGGIVLPEALAAQVLDQGVELAAAIDSYAGGRGIRDAEGAWGVLTRTLITREEAYRLAVIQAFAPFYNAPLYP